MFEKIKKILSHSFVIFAVVGGIGTIANLLIFFILADVLEFWEIGSAVLAFVLVSVQNYVLHHIWTFKEVTINEKLSFANWIKFNLTTLLGLGINLIVLKIILSFYEVAYKVIAQFCGVAFGTVFNYFGSRIFVFNKNSFRNKQTGL